MPKPLDIDKRAMIKASIELGMGMRETSRKHNVSFVTVQKYMNGDGKNREEFKSLVNHYKQDQLDEWIALSAVSRRKAIENIDNVKIESAKDFKDMVTSAAVATDKAIMIQTGTGPNQQPLSLQLLVEGNAMINISDKELDTLAMSRIDRGGE